MAMTNEFDPLFLTMSFNTGIPAQYLKMLAYSESGLKADKVTPSSNATGLFQVVRVVLTDYNKAHGTNFTFEDMKNPALNVQVASDLLRHILAVYRKNPALAPDWKDFRFVALFTAGFNAGYGGVAKLAAKLQSIGVGAQRITVETIRQAADEIKDASPWARFLAMPARLAYWRAVAGRYLGQYDIPLVGPVKGSTLGLGFFAIVAACGGLGYWYYKRQKAVKDDDLE